MNDLNLVNEDAIQDNSNDDELTQDEELAYQLYFRTCILSREMEILKLKLQKSVKMREKMIKKQGTVFHESFPFYFLNPELVICSILS